MSRLYYADSLLHQFDATVIACAPAPDASDVARFHVTLDRTAFYPTSGGQPHDTGTLGGAAVVDVIDDEATGEVVHVIDRALEPGATVRGEIDRLRRLDHMQQHTGQHMLSAAFDQLANARTESFHLGAESSTIDLSADVTPAQLTVVETTVNTLVWRDLEVVVRYVSEAEAAALPLRKASQRTGMLRLVEIPGFDLSACGGTHVPRTGMVGMIVVTGTERFKGGTRVSFACGGRALTAYLGFRGAAQTTARNLTVAVADLPDAVGRLQAQIKDQQKVIRDLQEAATARLAVELRESAQSGRDGLRVVVRAQPGWDANAIKFLASAIVSSPGMVVVLTGEGSPVPVVVARSQDVGFDAGAWMKAATTELGGRGGGRPEMAQGGISAATDDILARARATFMS